MFNFNKEYFFYKGSQKDLTLEFSKSIYCPHPFTNWSLNPSYAVEGKRLHTLEGFRKTYDEESTQNFIDSNPNAKWIYCLGGSTTYCTELYKNELTWPAKLASKMADKNVKVINGGVGGFGTLQSLIRFMHWGPLLRPAITIVYQSKNDLTPFYNGLSSEVNVLPMLENIMLPFSMAVATTERSYFKASVRGLAAVYSKKYHPDASNLERYDNKFLMLTKSRYNQMAKLAASWNGKVLFVPELIRPSPYLEKMNLIHEGMHDTAEQNENSEFYDLRGIFPMVDKYFLDKMHFSQDGCELLSDLFFKKLKVFA